MYLDKYGKELIAQKIGRGSIFKKLYMEIFKRDNWRTYFFKSSLYKNIPRGTVNFQNFISVCYFQYKHLIILDQDSRLMFRDWLESVRQEKAFASDEDVQSTISALINLLE